MVMVNIHLKNTILDDEQERYCEIYKITNLSNQKIYVGQAVSHILNHKRFRPYGMEGRFNCHVSEAMSLKKNQCHYLNNALRKYGANNFSLCLLTTCTMEEADSIEREEILKNNSLYPNGYNLNAGGKAFMHTPTSRQRVSTGVLNYFKDRKLQRFANANIVIDDIGDNFENYIRPLNRNNIQYGWYVYIKRIKADFGGNHISLEESKTMAIDFIIKIKELCLAKHLDAGNPLEPLLPLSQGNLEKELG